MAISGIHHSILAMTRRYTRTNYDKYEVFLPEDDNHCHVCLLVHLVGTELCDLLEKLAKLQVLVNCHIKLKPLKQSFHVLYIHMGSKPEV